MSFVIRHQKGFVTSEAVEIMQLPNDTDQKTCPKIACEIQEGAAMRRSFFLFAVLSIVFLHSSGWAQLSSEQEKRMKQLEENQEIEKIISQGILDFNKSSAKENVGRFQAVRLSNETIFIIDTKEGHLWVWLLNNEGSFLIYEGKLFPGARMGDVIEKSDKLKKQ